MSEAKMFKRVITMTVIDKVFCLIRCFERFWNNVTFRFSLVCSTILLDFFVSHGNQFYLTWGKLFKYLEALRDGRSLSRSIHVVPQIFLSSLLLDSPSLSHPPLQKQWQTNENLDLPHRTGNVLTSSLYVNTQVTMGTFRNHRLGR